jgi:esterase/lipase superfamily enzyme
MPETKLHVIAHSMGNIVALSALEKIKAGGQPPIGEIILAHPDVDQDRFRQFAEEVKRLGVGITLYTSRDDRAMWLSERLHGVPRIGGGPTVVAGVDTIDISGLGVSLWSVNHNIYSGNPILFGDIARLIASGTRPPDKRTRNFERLATEHGSYWRYRTTESGPTK